MKIAFFFEVAETRVLRSAKETVESFRSMELVRCTGFEMDKYVLYDPVVTSVSMKTDGWTSVPVRGPRIVCNCVSPLVRYMNRRSNPVANDYDIVFSVPSCWLCERRLDISMFVRLIDRNPSVLMVSLGGSPMEEVDGYSMYAFDDHAVPGYRKLLGKFYNMGDTMSFHCPSVVNVKALNEKVNLPNQYQLMTFYNNSGFKDDLMVLYPGWIHTQYGDGKEKLFSDLVGIRPQHWDKKETT